MLHKYKFSFRQLRFSFASLFAIGIAAANLSIGQAPAFEVEPSQHVLHGLDFESVVVTHEIWTRLRGPAFFVLPDSEGERPNDYLVGYKIENPKPAKTQSIQLSDGATAELGNSAFVILPAQRITTGPPAEIPDDLGFFVAYEAEVSGSAETTHVAVASSLRHHDEELPVVNENRALLLSSKSMAADNSEAVTIIDHFGLNQLKLGSVIMTVESAELE